MKLGNLLMGLFVGALGMIAPRWAGAEEAATQPATVATDMLGPRYAAKAYGLEFRAPANCTEIDKPSPDILVEFDRTDEPAMQLKVWRTHLQQSLPLSTHKDQFGQQQDGVLEKTINNIRNNTPSTQLLRNEVINVGRVKVGMIGVRYLSATQQRRYTQQAIFEAPNAQNRLYYFFELNSPAKPAAEPDDIENPAERLAYQTFQQVVDSVVLLDRKDVLQDQTDRLFRTRALFKATWPGAQYQVLRSALTTEQYLRVIRGGKDVGYSYVVEEFQEKPKSMDESMVRVGVRSRFVPQTGVQWDTQSWMSSTLDRKHEVWSTVAQCTDPKGTVVDGYLQLGATDERDKAVAIVAPQSADGALGASRGDQGNVNLESVRELQVTTTHRNNQLDPFKQQTPIFYVPQAYNYLLPRLLPLNRPTTYMFATFIAASPEEVNRGISGRVMARYMDVLPVTDVTFNGQNYHAVEITDRVGLDGDPTEIYYTPDGRFIGTSHAYTQDGVSAKEMVLPTDVPTLQRLWGRPDLTRPQEPALAKPGDANPPAIPGALPAVAPQ
ncbi:MAG: hypothetical protein M3O30_12785 [Planctomycetota bacterium]|nr:hypothetical protein [Planctomycetota bacterium]